MIAVCLCLITAQNFNIVPSAEASSHIQKVVVCDEDGNCATTVAKADKEWAYLEKNPDSSPDALEHAAKIQWYVGLAANYTTIFKAFCDKE